MSQPSRPAHALPAATTTERLEQLDTALEKARLANSIPGMAVAVVQGGDVVLLKGYGMAALEASASVTPETIFSIGSATKQFTATLAAMQVDAGRLRWDDPIIEHLPWFRVMAAGPEGPISPTIRDLLTHQAGFTRMAMLWNEGKFSVEQVLGYAVDAKPIAPLRSAFHYNNVMYSAAGVAVAQAAGGDWETVITEQLLLPLGMTHTYTSQTMARRDPKRAIGYRRIQNESLPAPHTDNRGVAPAGAIESDVADMSKWVRFLLAGGISDAGTLVSKESLHETWKPQVAAWGGLDYGIGWFVLSWHDRTLVEHGGNSDGGFSSEVALLPDEGIGFVLLANVDYTPLQQASIPLVFGTLLGEDVESTWPPAQHHSPSPSAAAGEELAGLLPADDLLRRLRFSRRAENLRRVAQFSLRGTIHMQHVGPKGTSRLWFTGDRRTRFESDMGEFGRQVLVVASEAGWIERSSGEPTTLGGPLLEAVRASTFPNILGDLGVFREIWLVPGSAGNVADTLLLVDATDQRYLARVDLRTGDILEIRSSVPDAGSQTITRYEDFRVVQGVRIPFRQVEVDPVLGETVIQFEVANSTRSVDASLFKVGE